MATLRQRTAELHELRLQHRQCRAQLERAAPQPTLAAVLGSLRELGSQLDSQRLVAALDATPADGDAILADVAVFGDVDAFSAPIKRLALQRVEQSCLLWKRREAHFCPRNVSSRRRWLEQQERMRWHGAGGGPRAVAADEQHTAPQRDPQWYCDKPLATNLLPWFGATRTQPSDVSISVFSGDNIRFSRGCRPGALRSCSRRRSRKRAAPRASSAACRDTWMRRFPSTSILLTASGDPTLPAVGLASQHEKWFRHSVGEPLQAVQMLQLLAYSEQLARHQVAGRCLRR